MSDSHAAWRERIRSDSNGLTLIGAIAICGFVGGFVAWASLAPLSGAVVASGTVAAAGRNIQIQHLEGGILRQLLVREGDKVARGQMLLVLDDTAAQAELKRLLKQVIILQARVARLSAERDGQITFATTFPDDLEPYVSEIQQVLDEEKKEFAASIARYQSERLILNQRVDRLTETQSGQDAQRAAITDQIFIIQEEIARTKSLLDQGLAVRKDYADLLRIHADLVGQRGASEAEVAAISIQAAEAKEQIERQKNQRIEDAVTKLNETRVTLADTEEQARASKAIWNRTTIRSPVDGIIVNSIYNIPGNVISPGEKIMEILPTNETPRVEARLQPTDIDAVKVGQHARLRLVALNARLTPEIRAEVEYVSADRLIDQATQEPYYRAILRVNEELPPRIRMEDLHPGMPAEAFIDTGERTFFEYLLKPIADSANRAFTEE